MIFFIKGFFHEHRGLTKSRRTTGTFFSSTLSLPPAHEHSGIYLQLCMWEDYHIFLIPPLVFTRLLLDEICHLIELAFGWMMMWCYFCLFAQWFDSRFLLPQFYTGNRHIFLKLFGVLCHAYSTSFSWINFSILRKFLKTTWFATARGPFSEACLFCNL